MRASLQGMDMTHRHGIVVGGRLHDGPGLSITFHYQAAGPCVVSDACPRTTIYLDSCLPLTSNDRSRQFFEGQSRARDLKHARSMVSTVVVAAAARATVVDHSATKAR
jgi:hypothetical protein